VRQRIVRLAGSLYAGCNDHQMCEKLCEREGFSLSRETLRRLLRAAGLSSPRKRRAPAHRQRRMRSACEGQIVLLDGSPHDWLEGRGPLLTALGFQDDASGKILAAEFFPAETSEGYFRLLHRLLWRYGVPLAFYGDRHSIFVRNDDHWTVEEQLAGRRHPSPPVFPRYLEPIIPWRLAEFCSTPEGGRSHDRIAEISHCEPTVPFPFWKGTSRLQGEKKTICSGFFEGGAWEGRDQQFQHSRRWQTDPVPSPWAKPEKKTCAGNP
jgi:hypothetical protein